MRGFTFFLSLSALLMAQLSQAQSAAPAPAPAASSSSTTVSVSAPLPVSPSSPPPLATAAPASTPVEDVSVAAAPSAEASFFPEAPAETPPPLPHKKGLVLETGLGGLAFLGKFGSLAPTAPWIQTQLGWEFLRWLMVYGYGELAFTGTSNESGELATDYFPLYGFGGGVRGTITLNDRVALYVQGNAGAMSAIVPRDTLTFLGFGNAEKPGFSAGGRFGVEWYQIDHHMALSLGVGLRYALNFKIEGESDVPLMLDACAALRYTF